MIRTGNVVLAVMLATGLAIGASACSSGEHATSQHTPSHSVAAAASDDPSVSAPAASAPAGGATATTAPLGDSEQTWPATDLGARFGAMGQATEEKPGVYRYVVAANDTTSGLLERFDLCEVDIETAYEAAAGGLVAGSTITVQRSFTDEQGQDSTEFHRGWKCTYPEKPRTSRAG